MLAFCSARFKHGAHESIVWQNALGLPKKSQDFKYKLH